MTAPIPRIENPRAVRTPGVRTIKEMSSMIERKDTDERGVIYAAKSTTDVHGSIPAQIADCRKLAESQGVEIVAVFQDENASAYSGNRGADLALALAECERLAAEDGAVGREGGFRRPGP
jgi:hypothetical protein